MLPCQQQIHVFDIEQLKTTKELLSVAQITMKGLLEKEVASYQLDTTEGEQRTTRQRIDRLSEVIQRYQAEIRQLTRQVYGCSGLVHLNMRRTY